MSDELECGTFVGAPHGAPKAFRKLFQLLHETYVCFGGTLRGANRAAWAVLRENNITPKSGEFK